MAPHPSYPVNLDLHGIPCLVVGGGTVADEDPLDLRPEPVEVEGPHLRPALDPGLPFGGPARRQPEDRRDE